MSTQETNSAEKDGMFKSLMRLLSKEPLDPKKCHKTGGIIGLFSVPNIFFLVIKSTNTPFEIDFNLIVSITVFVVFIGGYLIGLINKNSLKTVLAVQGPFIVGLVIFYTVTMWNVAMDFITGSAEGGMGHAPGILASGSALGIKQFLNFSGISEKFKNELIYKIPTIFFIFGALCDIVVIYAMIQSFRAVSAM